MHVGILAVQGAFIEHAHCLEKLSVDYTLIRNKNDITDKLDHLIFCGGESTVQRKLIDELELYDKLKALIEGGVPTLGTCAGLIILAEKLENNETPCFSTLPVSVCRNAYGRQLGSFSTNGNIGQITDYPMRFIRAPYIAQILNPNIEILNTTDDRITAVKYKNQIGLAFHPELTQDLRIHKMFLDMETK